MTLVSSRQSHFVDHSYALHSDFKNSRPTLQVVRDGVCGGEDGPEDGGGHPGRDPGEEEEAEVGGGRGGRGCRRGGGGLVVKGEVAECVCVWPKGGLVIE